MKEKNPLDLLPPSSFVLDNWKRFYSNNSEVDSIKYFWDNVDLEGYSLWLASYMDNHLLKQTFMTCNLINGLFQRSERARKYAFGSFVIFGEDNDSELFAIYLVRGQEIPFELSDAPDFESYVLKKLEINDETKALVNAFLTWDDSIEGCSFASITNKKFNEGKIFK
ncbi:hypothetical protein H696_05111 [Fonticula alba]|uniref:EF-1-gamma C-terminal domain-containing protein n=1 Tax=Fonticula alba TaxID=691883 RepID=A0A058Z3T2_FONAL|nr:hypothetical protein H696_05111 [Fonticula alba]KCV68182.1 hypothetical protein H696_05111 [Fonticula alba]|eukprot:XP_009497236.1 hypothetical protein H696_05111 [Fonticula alba]